MAWLRMMRPAARLALTAGVDMEMISHTYRDTLKHQVEQGTVSGESVDEAVRRVLRVKFEKGLSISPTRTHRVTDGFSSR